MAEYYGVFKQPTLADYRLYQMMQGNADPTHLSFEEWSQRPGQGARVGGQLTKAQAEALAKQNPGSSVLGLHSVGTGIGDSFGNIASGLGHLAANPGVLESALVAAGGLGASALWGPGAAAAPSAAAGGGLSAELAAGSPLMPPAIPPAGLSASQMWGAIPLGPGAAGAVGAGVAGATGGAATAAAPVASAPSIAPAAAAVAPGVASGGLASALTSPTALGVAGGALLGGLGGSQQAGTIETEEGIPDWLRPYIKPQLDKYSTELQNYQVDPYGVMPSAMQEFQKTIGGQYLDPSTNKYLEDYFRLGAERIKGALSPSFGHMNAFGAHSGYNEALARGLGDFSVGLYGGNYAKERDRQTQMTAAAPNFLTQSSTAAFAPYQQYLSTVGSLGRKREEPFFENPYGNILGGALLGGSLGSMFK